MRVRPTNIDDRATVLDIHGAAFGTQEEPKLVDALLGDVTAEPRISLIAENDEGAFGHVLLCAAQAPGLRRLFVLAPLAVVPGHQKQGVGTALIRAGLTQAAPHPVTTFGDPAYYGRFGFVPGLGVGLLPPHDSALAYPGAWQVARAPAPIAPPVRVTCAKALMPARYWAV